VAQNAGLGLRDTDLLVSLWQKASDPAIRRFLLTEPHTAIQKARPEKTQAPLSLRSTQRGKALVRGLPILRGVALPVSEALHPAPGLADLKPIGRPR